MTEEERILRVKRKQWKEVETGREIPEWFPMWEDLELASRPEKEIRKKYDETTREASQKADDDKFPYLLGFSEGLAYGHPYLSEERRLVQWWEEPSYYGENHV